MLAIRSKRRRDCDGNPFQQIRANELDAIGEVCASALRLRHLQRRRRNIGGDKLRARQIFRERDGDASGASPDVGDVQAFAAERLLATGANFAEGQPIERDFDDVFGFGAGNQDVGRDFEFESPEFLLAGQILRRFAGGAPRNERRKIAASCSGDNSSSGCA